MWLRMKLLLGFSVEKFYSSGMVLRVGDGKIKTMSGRTRHEVQSEEIGGAVRVSRIRKGHHHRSRGRNEYGTQRGTWSTTNNSPQSCGRYNLSTVFTGPAVQLSQHAVSSFFELT